MENFFARWIPGRQIVPLLIVEGPVVDALDLEIQLIAEKIGVERAAAN